MYRNQLLAANFGFHSTNSNCTYNEMTRVFFSFCCCYECTNACVENEFRCHFLKNSLNLTQTLVCLIAICNHLKIITLHGRWAYFLCIRVYGNVLSSPTNKNHFTLKNYEIHIHKLYWMCVEWIPMKQQWRQKRTHTHLQYVTMEISLQNS